MRYVEFKLRKDQLLSESSSANSSEVADLISKTNNPQVLSRVINFLKKAVLKAMPDSGDVEPMDPTDDVPARTTTMPSTSTDTTSIDNQVNESDSGTLKDEALNLINKLGNNADELHKLISFLRKNEIYELSSAAIETNIGQGIKEKLDIKLGDLILGLPAQFNQKEEFLTQMAHKDGFWDGKDLINNPIGNVYQKLSSNPVATLLAKPLALQFRGKMGYGPDQGPGEFLLAFTGKGLDLAAKSDIILNGSIGIEVKASGSNFNKSTKKRSVFGGRLYSTSGYNGGVGARQLLLPVLQEIGIPDEELAKFGWLGREDKVRYQNLNFNRSGFKNLNMLLRTYTKPGSAEKVLAKMAHAWFLELPPGSEDNMVKFGATNNQLDYDATVAEFVAIAFEYYKSREGHDYVMIFNTESGNYLTIKDGDSVRRFMRSGDLIELGGLNYFDDRSKGSPQLSTK